jgi:GNAT superfamily N-acetyltransferase
MTDSIVFSESNLPTGSQKRDIISFLFNHLDQYGDTTEDIEKAVDYALGKNKAFGGFVLARYAGTGIIGAVVVNRTGMKGYIPENILVYIAIHKEYRGKGLGRQLMEAAIQLAEGGIALHVEPENPARYLYENLGFKSKYLEMRLQNSVTV